MKEVVVTTSWDDGHKLDVRLAGLLKKYNIKGTFYISPRDWEFPKEDLLTDQEIKSISESFEIGAHTMTHTSLPSLAHNDAKNEIEESKKYLENITKNDVTSFCYPRGEYKAEHVQMVKNAGFKYARTVNRHSYKVGNVFEASTTIHTYNHYLDLWKIAKFAHFDPLQTYKYFQWDVLAKAMFDHAFATGGTYHLWGHSWEIEKYRDWEKLESVLSYISYKNNVTYVTNSELVTANPEKILISIPYFPPYNGGTQMYAYNIAKQLQNNLGWNLSIATTGKRGFYKTTKEKYENLTIYRLPYWFRVSNTPINPLWVFSLKKIIKDENISVINAHAPVPFMSDVTAAASKDIPFVLTYHSGSMMKAGDAIIANIIIMLYEWTFLKILLNRANKIVCPSDFVRFGFLRKYSWKSSTITPAVDIDIFKPGPNTSKNPTILFVAGLTKSEQHKGLTVLIDAFIHLSKIIKNLRLVIVGDGDMRHEYELRVKEKGISDKITFKGRLTANELAPVYQQSDVFVLPSLAPSESFGMVLAEAMASGKPVIGAIAGGIPLVIDHEVNGLLVESGNSTALANAIYRLLDNPGLSKQYGEEGLQKVRRLYTWPRQAVLYDKLFKDLLQRKPTIAQVVGYYPPHLGGMEIVAKEITEELARNGYPVFVYTSTTDSKQNKITIRDYRLSRLATTEIAHTPILWTLPFRLLSLPRNSIIHVHISQAGIPEIVLLVSKLKNIPFVAHFHLDVGPSGPAGIFLPIYKRYFLGSVLRKANKVIVFSKEQSIAVQKIYNVKEDNISIIPNGVASDFFINRSDLSSREVLELLYVGRLSTQKHVERIVTAMTQVKIPAHLTIVGDGEDRTELEELTKNLGVKNISFVGKKNHSELLDYYARADAFLISSDIEGMPLVVLEAMAAGLPIMGTNVPGIHELVQGTGILVEKPYENNFATAISEFAKNIEKQKKLSVQSREKAKDYTWKSLVNKLEDLYNEISL